MTRPDDLVRLLRSGESAKPRLVWYAPEERIELSGRVLATWTAKAADLLQEPSATRFVGVAAGDGVADLAGLIVGGLTAATDDPRPLGHGAIRPGEAGGGIGDPYDDRYGTHGVGSTGCVCGYSHSGGPPPTQIKPRLQIRANRQVPGRPNRHPWDDAASFATDQRATAAPIPGDVGFD